MADPAVLVRLRQTLTAAASPNGGWPYCPGTRRRIEPTAWAMLALGTGGDPSSRALLSPHLSFLASCQRADGLLVDDPQAPPNFTANGTAACALAALADDRARAVLERLLGGLVANKGVAVDQGDSPQNNRLQGWPWIPETFSWVEPTAWCTLALKIARPRLASRAAARVAEAEQLLIDRCCDPGGWNYGNATAVGQDLRPYVPTTAVALLAMQDRRTDPAVVKSIAYLVRARTTESSAMALSLASIALRAFDRPAAEVDDVNTRLEADVARAERLGNLQALAMAYAALASDRQMLHVARIAPESPSQ